MKPVVNVVNAIGELVGRLTLPAQEKKELEAEVLKLMHERERGMAEAQASVLRAAIGDVDVRGDYSDGYVHDVTDSGRFFPILGFVGNWVGRLCFWTGWGEDCGNDI